MAGEEEAVEALEQLARSVAGWENGSVKVEVVLRWAKQVSKFKFVPRSTTDSSVKTLEVRQK